MLVLLVGISMTRTNSRLRHSMSLPNVAPLKMQDLQRIQVGIGTLLYVFWILCFSYSTSCLYNGKLLLLDDGSI